MPVGGGTNACLAKATCLRLPRSPSTVIRAPSQNLRDINSAAFATIRRQPRGLNPPLPHQRVAIIVGYRDRAGLFLKQQATKLSGITRRARFLEAGEWRTPLHGEDAAPKVSECTNDLDIESVSVDVHTDPGKQGLFRSVACQHADLQCEEHVLCEDSRSDHHSPRISSERALAGPHRLDGLGAPSLVRMRRTFAKKAAAFLGYRRFVLAFETSDLFL